MLHVLRLVLVCGAGAGARLPVDYLPPLPLYPGLVESEMADGQKLGGQGPLRHAAHQAAM